jgi:hypothetical protein
LAATAHAAGSISPTVLDSTLTTQPVTVTWSAITIPAGLNNVVYIQQCWKSDVGAFNRVDDCSPQSLNLPVGTGSGTQVIQAFNGDEVVNQLWGCGPLTSAGVPTPADGKCYIRIAPGSLDNTASDEFFAFSYGPGTPVPEVPLNILLPGSAVLVLGGAVLIARRRQARIV